MAPQDEEEKSRREREARERQQDRALRDRAQEDPGAGFTRDALERSRNTEFGQPPRPAGANSPAERR